MMLNSIKLVITHTEFSVFVNKSPENSLVAGDDCLSFGELCGSGGHAGVAEEVIGVTGSGRIVGTRVVGRPNSLLLQNGKL